MVVFQVLYVDVCSSQIIWGAVIFRSKELLFRHYDLEDLGEVGHILGIKSFGENTSK